MVAGVRRALGAALLLLFLAIVLSALGPGIDDLSAARDQAADRKAAMVQAQHRARYEAAAQQLCGDNAAWMQLEAGVIQCYTKRGHKTHQATLTAQVSP